MLFLEVVEFVFLASSSEISRKSIYLEKAIKKFDLLKFLLRIAWEIKALDSKKYAVLSEVLDEIGRMLGGWLKKAVKETPSKSEGEQRY